MNDQPQIDDLLEAYRPGVDDLGDDAWEPLRASLADDLDVQRRAEMIQWHDRVVRDAMHDTPVPAGLAERLLANLPQDDQANILSSAPASASEPVSLPPPPASTKVGRRLWGAAFIGTVSLVVLAAAFTLWPFGPTDPHGDGTPEDVARLAAEWEIDAQLASGGLWRLLTADQGLSSYPIDSANVLVPATGVIGPVQREGRLLVAYQLTAASGQTARLYVARTNRQFKLPATPTALRGLTGLRSGVAWQRGEYLYVVVVDSREWPDEFVRMPGVA